MRAACVDAKCESFGRCWHHGLADAVPDDSTDCKTGVMQIGGREASHGVSGMLATLKYVDAANASAIPRRFCTMAAALK